MPDVKLSLFLGPIVRINPNELHVNDPDFYDTLYAGGSHKRDKYVLLRRRVSLYNSDIDRYEWFTNAGGSPTSSFATSSHALHRLRRGALNPFFSKQSVVKLEPLIHEKVELLCKGMEAQLESKRPFDFAAAYMSLALDTVSHYAFGKDECWNCLSEPGFSGDWKEAIVSAFENATLVRYIPAITDIFPILPYRWIMKVHKPMGMYIKVFAVL